MRKLLIFLVILAGCPGTPAPYKTQAIMSPSGNGTSTSLTIHEEAQLIGGPSAQARLGDVLLANDKIRVVIQQPGKYPGMSSFGGNIIDADLIRPKGRPGADNFGSLVPLLNVEWTTNATLLTVENPNVVRVHGIIDTYDYLDIDFLEPIAKNLTGTSLYFAPRLDDMNDPFTSTDLNNIDIHVTTDYQLEPGKSYVKIITTLSNNGSQDVSLPVGDFLNGSGQVQLLIPGLGFSPALKDQITGDTPAVIYAGCPGIDVSYGYFYDHYQFLEEGKAIPTRHISTSLSYSGVTGVLLGDEFAKVFPVGGGRSPTIHFKVPANSQKQIVRYFVVGNGSAGSVMDAGLEALGVPSHRIQGRVVNGKGVPIAEATVAVMNADGKTIVTYTSDETGTFSGQLSTGDTQVHEALGKGQYTVSVYKKGYAKPGTSLSGECTPDIIDLRYVDSDNITCILGEPGVLQVSGGVVDVESGTRIPARMTVVGFDAGLDAKKRGGFFDKSIYDYPYGIADVQYINALGGFGLTTQDTLPLSPGSYLIAFSHGPEYSIEVLPVTIGSGGVTSIPQVKLKRVVTTPGLIGADFHVHAIRSPDSAVTLEARVLQAVAEGLDVLHSSEHDYLVDYAPVMQDLVSRGIIPANSLQTIVGNEISPNSLGHIHVFPLFADPLMPNGGATDWSWSSLDTVNPAPDYTMTVREIIRAARSAPGPKERVIQINHIAEAPISIPIITGWVTSPVYQEGFGVKALSTYVDPVTQRMSAVSGALMPIPFEDSPMISTDFDAIELAVGPELSRNHLLDSALPVWFNLLNLGLLATATANSDSHTEFGAPLGLPRNYIMSEEGIDVETYAHPINRQHLVISAGPIVTMTATNESGQQVRVGDVISGKRITLHIDVQAPSWAWFDSIEIFANTEPTPADDDGVNPLTGSASDPKSFFASYHLPKYVYQPTQVYRVSNGTLPTWKNENGRISASLDLTIVSKRDTWVVAFARGTRETKGYQSLFPFAPHAVKDDEVTPKITAPFTLNAFHADALIDAPAWALTNPIFIDVDGDTNNDGSLFESLYMQLNLSPITKIQKQ